jgi:hypothetical protein
MCPKLQLSALKVSTKELPANVHSSLNETVYLRMGTDKTFAKFTITFHTSLPGKRRDITAVHAGTRLDVSWATYQLHKHNSTLKKIAPF